jgi:hypothetical protein
MLLAGRHWPAGREGGEGGAPSQKTYRLPKPEPLAEGGFVFRRLIILAVAAALFAVLAEAALAVNVRVRVEGKTTTIFGATEPTLTADTTALDALDAASTKGEFYFHVRNFAFGAFVDQIGRYPGAGSDGWSFKVNGVSPEVASDKVTLKTGDVVLWYWSTFGPAGGSPTLVLRRQAKRNCYAALSQNDAGATTPAAGAALHVDGRRVATRAGRACVGRHRGLVRAMLTGAVRSNALR